jgi:hypothetical protein
MMYNVPGQEGNPGDPQQVSYAPYNPAQGQMMNNQAGYWAQGPDGQQPVFIPGGMNGQNVQGRNPQGYPQGYVMNGGPGPGQRGIPGQGQFMGGPPGPNGMGGMGAMGRPGGDLDNGTILARIFS